MDLLLDVNVVLDLCTPRPAWYGQVKEAIELCTKQGGQLWLYAGSVQALEYNLRQTLREKFDEENEELTIRQIAQLGRRILAEFSQDKNWLAALSGDCAVFASDEPEAKQLMYALDRFPPDTIKLLTRDKVLLKTHPEKTVSPEQYCLQSIKASSVNFIDLAAQQRVIRPQLEKGMHEVLHHGRYILGSEVQDLEKKLADFVGVNHCVGVSSGTDALFMALMAKGIGPGDAVFTTPFTFIATAEVISLLGATPVFVDIDPRTFNLDPAQLEKALRALQAHDAELYPLPLNQQELTAKAIIPVDMFGLPADYDPIMALAAEHDLFVLEDAAQGLGGVYKGRMAGSLGHAAATSFFPAKPLGCYGDGGAVFTDDQELADAFRSIRVHGKGLDKYDNIRIGLNARLHTMQAAILLAKFDCFKEELIAKNELASHYSAGLSTVKSTLTTPHVPEGLRSAWAQYSLLAGAENRPKIQEALKAQGIPTAVYYQKSLHLQPAYAHLGYAKGDMQNSEDVSGRIFSLPMHAYLQEWQKIVDVMA